MPFVFASWWPQSLWQWALLLWIVWILYRRFTAHSLGRTVGSFRASVGSPPPSKTEAAAALVRSESLLERNLKALDLPATASYDQVKSSYRELVKVWHPDRFGHDVKLKARANSKLMEINQAYESLKAHFEK